MTVRWFRFKTSPSKLGNASPPKLSGLIFRFFDPTIALVELYCWIKEYIGGCVEVKEEMHFLAVF